MWITFAYKTKIKFFNLQTCLINLNCIKLGCEPPCVALKSVLIKQRY